MDTVSQSYAQAYSSKAMLVLLDKVFSKLSLEFVTTLLSLYYLARSPDLPLWAKAGVIAALGYFVVTPDAIPDVAPVVGFVDDLAVLASTLSGLAAYVTPRVREQVERHRQRLLKGDKT